MGKLILIGATIGGIITWLLQLSIPAGIVIGTIIGAISHGLFFRKDTEKADHKNRKQKTILLKEEQINIKKERVKTGEVKVHKEVVEDKKTFTVPIKREDIVIEVGDEEELRIPLKEEEVSISKHPVQLNEVSVTKRKVCDIAQVKETVKKEVADIDVNGEVDLEKNT